MQHHKLVLTVFVCLISSIAGPAWADDCDRSRGDWPMFNRDLRGTRTNPFERTLTRQNVGHLHVAWNVATPAPVTGTPAVVGDTLYVGDWAGNFYALGTRHGTSRWQAQLGAPVSASALVQNNRIFVGDQAGFVYALDRHTGSILWQVQPNTTPFAAIFSSPTPVNGNIVIGVASNEEEAAGDPTYPCCSFRGSLVMLNPADGHIVWQTYFVSEAESAAGTSGAAAWSTPTYDEESGLIYISTGNNYSAPTNGMEDSVIAVDATSGAIVWVNQAVSGDVGNFGLPIQEGSDSDYGDSPQIYRLANGRKVVSAGNKNGIYYVMDAATGELLNAKQLQTGGSLGGLFADSAVSHGVVFTNGTDWPNPFDFSVLPNFGILTAISGDASQVLWQRKIPEQVTLSGLAVANDVLYAAACNPGTGTRLVSSGTLFALSTTTGETLAALPVDKCANSGPAVAHGRVFIGLGNEYLFEGVPTGNIIAYGL